MIYKNNLFIEEIIIHSRIFLKINLFIIIYNFVFYIYTYNIL